MGIQVAVKATGLMLMEQTASGFNVKEIEVPSDWRSAGDTSWLKGFPLSLEITPGSGAVHDLKLKGSGQHVVVIYSGSKDVAETVCAQLQRAWAEANGVSLNLISAPNPASAPIPAAEAQVAAAPVVHVPAQNAGNIPADALPQQMPSKRAWRMPAVALASVALLAIAGYGSYSMFQLRTAPLQGAPSVDLSSMSVEDLSKVEGNPEFMRNVQDEMMKAVQIGQATAQANAPKIQQQHIDTLKGMGLDPGTSMTGAAACLANL